MKVQPGGAQRYDIGGSDIGGSDIGGFFKKDIGGPDMHTRGPAPLVPLHKCSSQSCVLFSLLQH